MKKVIDNNVNKWLTKILSNYKSSIVWLVIVNVLSIVCSIGFAYLSSYLINGAIEKNESKIILFSIVLLSLLIGRVSFKTFSNFYSEKCRASITKDLRSKLFKKILKSEYSVIEKYHSGDLVTRITADTNEIANITVGFLPQLVGIAVQVLGVIGALFAIDGWFAVVLIVSGGLIVLISSLLRNKIRWYHKEIMKADANSRSFMQESIVSSLTIKAFNAEEQISQKSDEILTRYKQRRIQRAKINSFVGVVFSCLTNFGLAFAIVWCVFGLVNGMEYGAVVAIILLVEQLQRPIVAISSLLPAYHSRIASAERLYEIDNFNQEQSSVCDVYPRYEQIKNIIVKDVCFGYDRDSVLQNLNASLEIGKTTCVFGQSGSGKSTLLKLLLGVYKPDSGAIILQTDKDEVELTSAHRKLFAYVPQSNVLFAGTIYENLTFFSQEKDKDVLNDKIERALKYSCAQFVYDLPNKLETHLTEQGGGLSEGQKQRLAIARALISDRPIIILDEATSALDNDTEERFINNLMAINDKTCIIISHRDAVIKSAYKSIKI